QLLEHPRAPAGRDRQRASLLGPCFSRDEIARFLAKVHAPHERFDDEAELLRRTAELLADGKIVGWFHGRMEFGPRRLGGRTNVGRSTVPAVTHVDFSARVQTVDRARHPRFYRLLEAFHSLTGCPVLVNTSFNVRGEPIVCTPQEAHRCYRATGIDALVLEDFVLVKSPGAPEALAEEREQ